MTKISLNDLSNLQNENTAVTKINQNNHTIEQAFDNTLSRDGSTPNQMESDLDMNSNDVLNVNKLTTHYLTLNGVDVVTSDLSVLDPVPDGQIFSNIAGSSAPPKGNYLTDILDKVVGNTRGSLITRGASGWQLLPPGNNNYFLSSSGPGEDLSYKSLPGGGDMNASTYDPTGIARSVFDASNQTIYTRAQLIVKNIPSSTIYVRTSGYATSGDGGAAFYKKVALQPSHAAKFQSADGAWWELDERIITPMMLGAIADGDGSGGGTNNYTAIQNTLTAAGAINSVVVFPKGTYLCNSGLTVPANVAIEGYGAVLDFKNGSSIKGMTFSNGGAVYGLKLIGQGNSVLDTSSMAFYCAGVNNVPSAPTYVNGPKIHDCYVDGWGSYGVLLAYVNNAIITGCTLTNLGYTGVGGVSCNDCIVDSNLIDGITPGTTDAYGIFFDRYDGVSETSDPRSYRCVISNNIIKNVKSVSGRNGQGIDTHGGVDFRIIGNSVLNCQVGIFITYSSIAGVGSLGPKRNIVSGNVISTNLWVGYGIMVSGAFNGSSVTDWAEGNEITNNTIVGHGIAEDGTSGCINLQGTKGTIIQGNSIKYPRCNGIRLNVLNLNFNISGNTIQDPFDSSFQIPSCISVQGSDNRGYIGANTFYFEAEQSTYTAIRSISIGNSLTGLSLDLDRCSFNGIASGKLSYVAGSVSGVRASTLMVQSGSVIIPLDNSGSVTAAVTLDRFPVSTPKVTLQMASLPVPGSVNKYPLFDTSSKTATGFNVIARPYDLTTFGGTGEITVDWIATT